MAEIRPFRGLRYGSAVDLQVAVAPPYDVLSAAQAAELRERSSVNAVHIDLPVAPGAAPASRSYASAGDTFRAWRRNATLRRDDEPALYVIGQTFRGPDGGTLTRHGFIARLVLDENGGGLVRPHEKTHSAPRIDRLELMRATHADLSPVFLLYPDDDGSAAAAVMAAGAQAADGAREVRDADGNRCRITPVRGQQAHRIVDLLRARDLYIADGHHRYQTALAYRDERRRAGDESAGTLMVFLCSMNDPGLAVFPAHRLLKGIDVPPAEEVVEHLRPTFAVGTIQPVPNEPLCFHAAGELHALSEAADDPAGAFVLVFAREDIACTLTLRDREALRGLEAEGLSAAAARLSVSILHHLILRDAVGLDPSQSEGRIDYVTDSGVACELLAQGRYDLGAFLTAPSVADVRAIADLGETMPQKSTYFYPKLLTGLVYDALGD